VPARATRGCKDPVSRASRFPPRSALLRDYTLYVINKDWPAHQQRLVPMGGENGLLAFSRQLLSFQPQSKTQEIAQQANVQELARLMSAREQRLSGVSTSIPGTLWYAVWIGASQYSVDLASRYAVDLALVSWRADLGKPFSQLRTVLSFHSEFVALIARQEKGARGLDDLKRARINVGVRLGVIPGTVYGTAPIATFGPVPTLVATSKLDERIVASLTKAVLQNVAAVRGSLPALAELDRERVIADALSAPQHPGAKRAVADLGLNR
jgi:NMT1-like family